ncbi:MAG: hypothetical protein QHC90_08250 [Shinella sp.]|nr:hypothetical protein [Shinella sp.]
MRLAITGVNYSSPANLQMRRLLVSFRGAVQAGRKASGVAYEIANTGLLRRRAPSPRAFVKVREMSERSANELQEGLAPLSGSSMKDITSSRLPLQVDVFAPKTEAAWTALQQQYASLITAAEVDHLLACFVFGLTSPAFADGEANLHFDACRALMAIKLPPERIEAALRSVPATTQPWVESARRLIESKGVKMGSALRQDARNIEEITGVDANSKPTERLGNNEEMYND